MKSHGAELLSRIENFKSFRGILKSLIEKNWLRNAKRIARMLGSIMKTKHVCRADK